MQVLKILINQLCFSIFSKVKFKRMPVCLVNMYRNHSISFYKRPRLLSFSQKPKQKQFHLSHIRATELEQQTRWSDVLRGWKWGENYPHVWQKVNIWCMWLVSLPHCSLHNSITPLLALSRSGLIWFLSHYICLFPSIFLSARWPPSFAHITCSTVQYLWKS